MDRCCSCVVGVNSRQDSTENGAIAAPDIGNHRIGDKLGNHPGPTVAARNSRDDWRIVRSVPVDVPEW